MAAPPCHAAQQPQTGPRRAAPRSPREQTFAGTYWGACASLVSAGHAPGSPGVATAAWCRAQAPPSLAVTSPKNGPPARCSAALEVETYRIPVHATCEKRGTPQGPTAAREAGTGVVSSHTTHCCGCQHLNIENTEHRAGHVDIVAGRRASISAAAQLGQQARTLGCGGAVAAGAWL